MPGLYGNRLNLDFLHMLDKVLKLTTDLLNSVLFQNIRNEYVLLLVCVGAILNYLFVSRVIFGETLSCTSKTPYLNRQ